MCAFKGPEWNDSEGIEAFMRPEVMRFDVVPMAGFPYTWLVEHSFDKCL
jgi:hypothetical protein